MCMFGDRLYHDCMDIDVLFPWASLVWSGLNCDSMFFQPEHFYSVGIDCSIYPSFFRNFNRMIWWKNLGIHNTVRHSLHVHENRFLVLSRGQSLKNIFSSRISYMKKNQLDMHLAENKSGQFISTSDPSTTHPDTYTNLFAYKKLNPVLEQSIFSEFKCSDLYLSWSVNVPGFLPLH